MEKVLEIYYWIADVFLSPGNKWACRKATLEGEKGLLEGGARARVAGCSRGLGACTAVGCLVFWADSSVLVNLLPAGLLGACSQPGGRSLCRKVCRFQENEGPCSPICGGRPNGFPFRRADANVRSLQAEKLPFAMQASRLPLTCLCQLLKGHLSLRETWMPQPSGPLPTPTAPTSSSGRSFRQPT